MMMVGIVVVTVDLHPINRVEESEHLDSVYRQLSPSARVALLGNMAKIANHHLPRNADPWTHHLSVARRDKVIYAAALLLRYHAEATEVDDVSEHIWRNSLAAYRQLDSDKIKQGEAMLKGRKSGSISPITSAVRSYLKRNGNATAEEVWRALSKKPPRGHVFIDSPRLGKYIELKSTGETVQEWARFKNVVTENRPACAKRSYVRKAKITE